jgi:2-oxoacid:acceptor oxidoreductase gamma subunit (pyruvate/2-ketoisovalerate family)
MLEIKILGRGGQGVVSSSYVLAAALFNEGYTTQAFPMYGVERTGGPARAFIRVDKKPITRYDQIYNPTVFIIFDTSLVKEEFENLKNAGLVIINTTKKPEEFRLPKACIVKTIDATTIAMKTIGKPFFNVPMLGAFAGYTKLCSVKSLDKAIEDAWKTKGKQVVEGNKESAKKAYNLAFPEKGRLKI